MMYPARFSGAVGGYVFHTLGTEIAVIIRYDTPVIVVPGSMYVL